jgi:hypothetical protein
LLFNAMHLGGGDISGGKGTKVYTVVSKRLADDVHEILFKLGYAARVTWRPAAMGRCGKDGAYVVTASRARHGGNRVNLLKDHRSSVPYEGMVHCLEVPNHTLYVRRNGKSCWSGNSWVFKKTFEEIEAIAVERELTGLPVLTPPAGMNLWNPNDADAAKVLDRAETLVRNIRADQHQGVVLPAGWSLSLLASSGSRLINTTEILSRIDQRIAVTILADMLLIGQDRVGSFALVAAKTTLFSTALQGITKSIADVFNRHAIPRLLRANGLSTESPPQLVFGPVETPDLKSLADYVNKLVGSTVLTPDSKLERHLREVAGFPPEDPDSARVSASENREDGQEQEMPDSEDEDKLPLVEEIFGA